VLQSKLFQTPDSTRNYSYFIWNNVELQVGIIAACLPSLRPLFAALLDGAKSAARAAGITSSGERRGGLHHKYYMQQESKSGNGTKKGIHMSTLHSQAEGKSAYRVQITSKLQSTIGERDSEDDLKGTTRPGSKDSDESFIVRESKGIMKSVNVTITH
jgi:hypothetical protein